MTPSRIVYQKPGDPSASGHARSRRGPKAFKSQRRLGVETLTLELEAAA